MPEPDHERNRLQNGLRNAEFDEILDIVAAALRLEAALYDMEDSVAYLFRLRKSLEGIWGNDLPEVDEWGKGRNA